MKTLVVYDSVFGNTEKIAQAIGAALGSPGEGGVLRVGDMAPEQLAGVEVFIVGSPTRAFSPTPATKAMLKAIPAKALSGVKVAPFDTRISMADTDSCFLRTMVKVFGYAAKPIADRLKRKGGDLVLVPEGFYVQDTEGPLKEGEAERAAAWAQQVMAGQESIGRLSTPRRTRTQARGGEHDSLSLKGSSPPRGWQTAGRVALRRG